MEGEQERVLVFTETDERDAQHEIAAEIERAHRFFAGQALQVPTLRRDLTDRHGPRCINLLNALLATGDEARAQHFMPGHDRVEGLLQRGAIERPFDEQRGRHVVLRTPLLQLIDEPEALLRERRRQVAVARDGRERNKGVFSE
jgi:hypothetical protein